MKTYSLTFLLLINSVLFASDNDRFIPGSTVPYTILSDEYNIAVPEGYFALVGHVYYISSTNPVANARITNYVENQSRMSSTTSDSTGRFKMIFPITDSVIYCYKEDLNEVVFRGPFKNRHLIKINFFLQVEATIGFKPVIYAYNAASSSRGFATISLKPQGEFTFTYPKSNGEWNVKTNEDGTLTDLSNEKNYPYIFWEGLCPNLKFNVSENTLEGFLIKTDTCISFLENTLAQFGLNEKESTDFITFWGPKIIQKEFALIQFLSTEQYGKSIAEISIEPKPDALLRLYMYFRPLDSPELNIEIIQPKIDTFNRVGFTIVEWGGSVIEKIRIVN